MPTGIYPRNSKKKEKKKPQASRLITRQLRASLAKEKKAANEEKIKRIIANDREQANNFEQASPDPCNELRRELFQSSQIIKKQDQKIEALCQTIFNLARIVGGAY